MWTRVRKCGSEDRDCDDNRGHGGGVQDLDTYYGTLRARAIIIAGVIVNWRDRLLTTKQSAYTTIGHPGPAQVYLHRTDDLQNDIGDGDWFKIAYEGPINDTFWGTWVDPSTDVRSSPLPVGSVLHVCSAFTFKILLAHQTH
jgi:hypothetical protein